MATNPENKRASKTPENIQELVVNYHIPKEGSLGILALGARGVKAWRKVKNMHGLEK